MIHQAVYSVSFSSVLLELPGQFYKRSVQVRKWSRPANDPNTANDPQIGPQMIPRPEMIPASGVAKIREWPGLHE